eukprot:CFRG3755T1
MSANLNTVHSEKSKGKMFNKLHELYSIACSDQVRDDTLGVAQDTSNSSGTFDVEGEEEYNIPCERVSHKDINPLEDNTPAKNMRPCGLSSQDSNLSSLSTRSSYDDYSTDTPGANTVTSNSHFDGQATPLQLTDILALLESHQGHGHTSLTPCLSEARNNGECNEQDNSDLTIHSFSPVEYDTTQYDCSHLRTRPYQLSVNDLSVPLSQFEFPKHDSNVYPSEGLVAYPLRMDHEQLSCNPFMPTLFRSSAIDGRANVGINHNHRRNYDMSGNGPLSWSTPDSDESVYDFESPFSKYDMDKTYSHTCQSFLNIPDGMGTVAQHQALVDHQALPRTCIMYSTVAGSKTNETTTESLQAMGTVSSHIPRAVTEKADTSAYGPTMDPYRASLKARRRSNKRWPYSEPEGDERLEQIMRKRKIVQREAVKRSRKSIHDALSELIIVTTLTNNLFPKGSFPKQTSTAPTNTISLASRQMKMLRSLVRRGHKEVVDIQRSKGEYIVEE